MCAPPPLPIFCVKKEENSKVGYSFILYNAAGCGK
jgi:hypothetical protein